MKKHPKHILLANTFGTFGYITCILLWMWVGVLYLPGVLGSEQVKQFLIPAPAEEATVPAVTIAPSPISTAFAVGVTIFVIVLTIIVLVKAPVTIARTSKATTTKAASSVVPIVSRGKPLAKKEKRRLTAQLIKYIKLLLTITPVFAAALSAFVTLPLPFDIVMFISSVLAIIAIFWFSAQYYTALFLKVNAEDLV